MRQIFSTYSLKEVLSFYTLLLRKYGAYARFLRQPNSAILPISKIRKMRKKISGLRN